MTNSGHGSSVKPPASIWCVIDEQGQPCFCAGYPEVCHEHINEAIAEDIDDAGHWIVREYVLPADPQRFQSIMESRLD